VPGLPTSQDLTDSPLLQQAAEKLIEAEDCESGEYYCGDSDLQTIPLSEFFATLRKVADLWSYHVIDANKQEYCEDRNPNQQLPNQFHGPHCSSSTKSRTRLKRTINGMPEKLVLARITVGQTIV
jgi:hypothetical protein